jgi:F-type H+-transporting ATPase subunit b
MVCGSPVIGLSASQDAGPAQPAVATATPAAGAKPTAAPGARPQEERTPAGAPAQPHATEAAAGHGGAEGESESPWAAIARLFNFALLAGALVYLLRSPLMAYLEQRGVQVRSELTKAAALRQEAAAQLSQIDAKMQALPSEIDVLKRRGAEEIRAEEARIRGAADAERRRLLDQATREIDSELSLAQRELKARTGELAVTVATERITRTITDRDQARLVDRYVTQVRH